MSGDLSLLTFFTFQKYSLTRVGLFVAMISSKIIFKTFLEECTRTHSFSVFPDRKKSFKDLPKLRL